MDDERDILLERVQELGVHKSGRRVRSDKSATHVYPKDRNTRQNTKTRSDKGQSHVMTKIRSDKGQTHIVTKVRADKGQTHTITKTRADKGQTHTITKTRADKGQSHVMTTTRSDKGQTHVMTKTRADKGQPHMMTKTRADKGQTHVMTKTRSDKGQTHVMTKTRADKGQVHAMTKIVRADYGNKHCYDNKTSDFYFAQFQKALQGTALRNASGEVIGEGATRDANNLFDLRITHKWKTITKADGTTYKTKVRLDKSLEQYRWDWLHTKAEEGEPDLFCKTYHVKKEEWDMWTFSEWANAYIEVSQGGDLLEADIPYFDDNGQPIRYINEEER